MTTISYSDLRHDDDGRMLFEGELFSGVALEKWPTGHLQSETCFRDGLREGPATLWYQNGVKKSQTTYVGGCARV